MNGTLSTDYSMGSHDRETQALTSKEETKMNRDSTHHVNGSRGAIATAASVVDLMEDEPGQPYTVDEPCWPVLYDRAKWLVGLMVLQSCSSFILEENEALLQQHLVIVQFLTMLVGAGGNAGNQACVRGKISIL
jgi:hypothetical protein